VQINPPGLLNRWLIDTAILVNTGHAQPVLPDLYPSAGAGTVTAGGRTLSGAYGDVAPTIKEMP